MNVEESINATRKGFEESFAKGVFYNKQTQDLEHLTAIIQFYYDRRMGYGRKKNIHNVAYFDF